MAIFWKNLPEKGGSIVKRPVACFAQLVIFTCMQTPFLEKVFCFLKQTMKYPIFNFYSDIYISSWPRPDMG